MAEAQCTLHVFGLQIIAVRNPEFGRGLDEMPGVAADREIGHEVAVILENLRLGLGEGVEIGADLAEMGVLQFLGIAVPVFLEFMQFALEFGRAALTETALATGEPPERARWFVGHALAAHVAVVVGGERAGRRLAVEPHRAVAGVQAPDQRAPAQRADLVAADIDVAHEARAEPRRDGKIEGRAGVRHEHDLVAVPDRFHPRVVVHAAIGHVGERFTVFRDAQRAEDGRKACRRRDGPCYRHVRRRAAVARLLGREAKRRASFDVGCEEDELDAIAGAREFHEAPGANALLQGSLQSAGARPREYPVPQDVAQEKSRADIAADDPPKRRRDVLLPVIELEAPCAALEHAVGEEARQDAAAGHGRQARGLLQDAELVQAPRHAEVEQAGAETAARKREALALQFFRHRSSTVIQL